MTKGIGRDLTIHPRTKNLDLVTHRLDQLSVSGRHSTTVSGVRQRMGREADNARRQALRAVERTLRQEETSAPSIFLSYSGSGTEQAEIARRAASEHGFAIKTGFDAEVEIGVIDEGTADATLPQLIISQILTSTFFLGIWTPDFQGSNLEGRDARGVYVEPTKGYLPSVCMPFELGVAAAHGKPIRLLVQAGTHKSYYEKPFNLKPNLLFGQTNFADKLDSIMKYFERRLVSQIKAGA